MNPIHKKWRVHEVVTVAVWDGFGTTERASYRNHHIY